MQLKILFTTNDGVTLDFDTVGIIHFVEEDGKTKLLTLKDFCDPEKRTAVFAKVMEKGGFSA
jgi:hypothetical protein